MLGRGVRRQKGEGVAPEMDLVDMWDENHRVLERHSQMRYAVWMSERHPIEFREPEWARGAAR